MLLQSAGELSKVWSQNPLEINNNPTPDRRGALSAARMALGCLQGAKMAPQVQKWRHPAYQITNLGTENDRIRFGNQNYL